MNNEPGQEFTPIEELADIPLSDLVEPQWLDLPEIQSAGLRVTRGVPARPDATRRDR